MQKNPADRVLLIAVLALVVFSLVMIASIGVPKSIQLSAPNILYPNCGDPQVDCYRIFKGHLARLIIGVIVLLLAVKIPYKIWKKTSVFWYGLFTILLFIVLFVGSAYTTFARSWIVLFNTSLQPVEFAKLAMIFYLAHWMERKKQEIGTFQYGFLPFCIVTGVILVPILLQPDLGGSLIVMGIAVFMYFIAGAKIKHLALGAFLVTMMGILVITNVSHVRDRVSAFMNQEANCREDYCWQTEQANIAVGSGGFWGKGLTQGVQKSYWLPQSTDDFIFAASAEELGFVRMIFIIFAYSVIAFRGFMIAKSAPDRFSMLTAAGITSWIIIQAFMNISINIGLMPVTGITLPFVSYGGSSLLAMLIGVGILLQISKYATGYTPNTGRRWNRGTYNAQHSRN